jgi:hypothetical protein
MGKSQKILVQSSIIIILTIFVYYSLFHQPQMTPNVSTVIAKNPDPSMDRYIPRFLAQDWFAAGDNLEI